MVTEVKKYACDVCGHEFDYKTTAESLQKIHLTPSIKSYYYEVCGDYYPKTICVSFINEHGEEIVKEYKLYS